MQREGIRLGPDQRLGSSNSRRTLANSSQSRYHMEPDGVIFFRTRRSLDFKVVVKVSVSQTNNSLLEKARKWKMRSYYESQDYSEFGPLTFQGHTWMDRLCEGALKLCEGTQSPIGERCAENQIRTTCSLLICNAIILMRIYYRFCSMMHEQML
ncbi:hypothetical protein V1517DRAFT_319057 [Lipomyces orientalis]|uniref:Uncharacterized protein n=1 Tax=Lipomyces orientalis TaxID=1233043 RepID=A0ACC3TSZ7_9ASCO